MRLQSALLKFAGTLAAASISAGCDVNPASLGPGAFAAARLGVEARLNTKLDVSLTQAERALVKQDIKSLFRYGLEAPAGGTYAKFFGGRYSSSLAQYMDERIQVLVGAHVRQETDWQNYWFVSEFDKSWVRVQDDVDGFMAGNHTIWFEAMRSLWPIYVEYTPIAGPSANVKQRLRIIPGRTNIVQLGYWYADEASSAKKHAGKDEGSTSVARLSTLIHEARHSDCPEPLTATDRQRIRDGGVPANLTCGYDHVKCPKTRKLPDGTEEEHPLAGDVSCESTPWGPYAASMVFNEELVHNCPKCTERERQEALIGLAEEVHHLLYDWDKLKSGKYGPPKTKRQTLTF